MRRKTFDSLLTVAGAALAVLLLIAGGLLTWAHSFVDDQVRTQLAAQQIYFPPANSEALPAKEYPNLQKYGGKQLVNGEMARAYADEYIAAHLKAMNGGKTYSQLSTASRANPADTELAQKVQTAFRGETLRGLLLNAYAFGKMGQIAGIAAIAAFAGAAVLLLLVILGVVHRVRTPEEAEIFASKPAPAPGAGPSPATA